MNKGILTRNKQDFKKCKIDGCEAEASCKEMCKRHYNRFWEFGRIHLLRKIGKGKTPIERFWSLVAITANPEKCWEWQGGLRQNGYGRVTVNNKRWLAHRYAWFLINKRDAAQFLLHSCDNRKCVNPVHLREGTQLENLQDMKNRGRSLRGESNKVAKLTEENVRAIKELLKNGRKLKDIATIFNVHFSTISYINTGKRWAHIN